ncbi:MAG: SDR family NAD(P)-dependent oxidoreductase [Acetobacteraceae bacterium]
MLNGKSALITSSLGGIGFATAKALAEAGCDVVLNGFADAATITARVAEIEALCVRAAHHNADLRDPSQIATLIEATTQTHGAPDVLINNAVVHYFGAVENFAPEQWDEALAVNLSARYANVAGLIAFLCAPSPATSTAPRCRSMALAGGPLKFTGSSPSSRFRHPNGRAPARENRRARRYR